MDPFRSVPDQHNTHVRKQVSKHGPPKSDTSPTKRARANTIVLIDATDDLPIFHKPPPPEPQLSGYTKDRLRAGLRAVKHASQRRDITPRTATFLGLHKDAYKRALLEETPSKEACAAVQSMDNVYHSEAFIFSRQDPDTEQAMDTILKLRKLELMASYGDYVGQQLQQIRADLKEAARSGSPQLQRANAAFAPPKTWVDIGDNVLENQVEAAKQHLMVACSVLGLDEKHVIWLITEWGQRNKQFHNGIRESIIKCDWGSLAKKIHFDLSELTQVEVDEDIREHYEKAMLDVRDTFFLDAGDYEDPILWKPNQHAQDLTKERMERERRRSRG